VLTSEVFGDVEQPTTVHPARDKTAIKTQAFDMGIGSWFLWELLELARHARFPRLRVLRKS
jgi:hypothetical protein